MRDQRGPTMSHHAAIALARTPLATAMAVFFSVMTPISLASTWIVDDTCGDDVASGDLGARTGTLRFCVGNASSNDTIDLSQTTCSQISLTTGSISIDQQELTLHGAGKDQTVITGKDGNSTQMDRLFYATAVGGNVAFDNLSVTYGLLNRDTGPANGGCIYGKGSITLDNVGIYNCSATTTAASASQAFGGGVYAHDLTIRNNSVIANNAAIATQAAIQAQGGGAAASGTFRLYDSIVRLNVASATAGSGAFGGGLALRGQTVIARALISDNHSSLDGGGIDLFANDPGPTAVITNSTISMNGAGRRTGGIVTNFSSTTIANSTIAFNTSVNYFSGPPLRFYSPGVSANYRLAVGAATLNLQSTIIANNTSSGFENDLSAGVAPASITIEGSDNLVRAFSSDVTLPTSQGNISGACPLLGPLRDNGGESLTHALHSGSPSIGVGNNTTDDPITHTSAAYDQRGINYARSVDDLVDIGAYQRQHDNLFDTGFEGCQ
jgi:hypothetical protein